MGGNGRRAPDVVPWLAPAGASAPLRKDPMPQTVVEHRADLPTVLAPSSSAATGFDPAAGPTAELDRQVRAYVETGTAALAGLGAAELTPLVEPLRARVERLDLGPTAVIPPADHVPFVLVVSALLARPNDVVPAMRIGTRAGTSVIDDDELRDYRAIDGLEVPPVGTYLLTGVDTGSRFLNVTPQDALAQIHAEARSPLTIAEGLALVVLRPDMLRSGRCFSLAGSRTGTNQRVPAVWISQRRPKLGWCWDRNPHTWLGTASAAARTTVGQTD